MAHGRVGGPTSTAVRAKRAHQVVGLTVGVSMGDVRAVMVSCDEDTSKTRFFLHNSHYSLHL